MPGQGALAAVARAVLDSTAHALDTYGSGAPGLQYIAPGAPAYDCEQLTVHYGGISEAPTTADGALGTQHRSPLGIVLHQPVLVVSVVRECTPPAQPAAAAAVLVDTAGRTMDDGWLLWRWYHARHRDNTLFESCSEVAFLPAIPVAPSGGIYGWVFQFAVTLPAPDPLG